MERRIVKKFVRVVENRKIERPPDAVRYKLYLCPRLLLKITSAILSHDRICIGVTQNRRRLIRYHREPPCFSIQRTILRIIYAFNIHG